MRAVTSRIPEARLTIVGRGGNRSDFEAWADEEGVNYVGEVESVLDYYHRAALSVCPLRIGSGTRLKILEAMSTGTPVVSTTAGAEGLLESCSRALAIADDPEAFSDAVCRLLRTGHLPGSAHKSAGTSRFLSMTGISWDSG